MRYKDEKAVEAAAEAIAASSGMSSEEAKDAIVRTMNAYGTRVVDVSGKKFRGGGSSAAENEELVRRVRTELVAEAGLSYGRVSLEALYLLPSEFTTWYQRLFLRALRESPGRTGEPNPPLRPKAKLTRKSAEDVLDRDPDRGGGRARAGGRRHRDHWTIADERAFRLKKTIDDQLRELAEIVESSLSRAAANGDLETGNFVQCTSCGRFLKIAWRYCPSCGAEKQT